MDTQAILLQTFLFITNGQNSSKSSKSESCRISNQCQWPKPKSHDKEARHTLLCSESSNIRYQTQPASRWDEGLTRNTAVRIPSAFNKHNSIRYLQCTLVHSYWVRKVWPNDLPCQNLVVGIVHLKQDGALLFS